MFKPATTVNDWEEEYNEGVFLQASVKYAHLLKILEEAIKNNTGINDLIQLFPDDFVVILGDNCSGVDTINLAQKTVEEMSW